MRANPLDHPTSETFQVPDVTRKLPTDTPSCQDHHAAISDQVNKNLSVYWVCVLHVHRQDLAVRNNHRRACSKSLSVPRYLPRYVA